MKLPDLIKFEDYKGDWNKYIEAVYSFFKKDFIDGKPRYNGNKVVLRKYPLFKGKEACFWHITSEGEDENKRTPDLRKCERIRWIKPIIESYPNKEITFWKSKRKNRNRICLCYGDWEYLVVLEDRTKYILLMTAHPIEREHTKKKLEKEYEEYTKQTPPF